MHLYMAEDYYQRAMGYWPFKGEEVKTAKVLLTNAMDLLKQVDDT